MKVFVGADHKGFGLKNNLVSFLKRMGYEVEDLSEKELNPDDDFPVYAGKVATAVLAAKDLDTKGIVLCGSGQGVCMTVKQV